MRVRRFTRHYFVPAIVALGAACAQQTRSAPAPADTAAADAGRIQLSEIVVTEGRADTVAQPRAAERELGRGQPLQLAQVRVGDDAEAADSALADADEVVAVVAGQARADAPAPTSLGARRAYQQKRVAPERDRGAAEPPATQGALRARDAGGKPLGDFPLRHTEVTAEVSGYLARTVVEQQYTNPFERAIEAVYVFPLPGMAAVHDFVMQSGGHKIVGVVRPRAEAQRIYQEARARGQTASLLTQERPNIFTQSVANIEPGGAVTIRITYVERLTYAHGQYEWTFPMVVGPRYIPGAPTLPEIAQNVRRPATDAEDADAEAGDSVDGGGGWSPPTDRVPDADRITPPVLKPGQRSGHDIGLTVRLDAGLPIERLEVPTHRVEVTSPSATQRVVTLARRDAIPNRDFVLRWSVAGAETRFGVLAHRAADGAGGYFTLTAQPPRAPTDEQVTPREITFIMDVSGSMMGLPIGISKEVVTRALDRLRPADKFNVVYFAAGNAQLWEAPRLGTRENVAAAKRFLETLSAGGGTEMLAGVRRALRARHDRGYLQMYVFLTDGYVGDEADILRAVKEERGDARFFAFGIGSSVNRYLIDGIGEYGGGSSFVVIPRDAERSEQAVDRLFGAIDSPVLVDVAIDWNGLPVEDVYPRTLPDLFAGQTLNVIGRYAAPARGTAYVTARVGARRLRIPVPVDLPAREPAHSALAPAWARAKIQELSGALLTADAEGRAALEREITDLAVRHRLASQYTAFVAVDESRVVSDGRPVRVMQPVELPEGVRYEGIFGGEKPVGAPVRIGAWGATLQPTDAGRIRVADVARAPGAAALAVGAAIVRVNRVAVTSLVQLETLLLQSDRSGVRVELEPGGEVVLPAP